MGWLSRMIFGPEEAPVVEQPAVNAQVIAPPIVVNPTDRKQLDFAEYRSGAILRDRQQREDEGREAHPEHDALTAEARLYANMLVQAGRWTEAKYKEFEVKLLG